MSNLDYNEAEQLNGELPQNEILMKTALFALAGLFSSTAFSQHVRPHFELVPSNIRGEFGLAQFPREITSETSEFSVSLTKENLSEIVQFTETLFEVRQDGIGRPPYWFQYKNFKPASLEVSFVHLDRSTEDRKYVRNKANIENFEGYAQVLKVPGPLEGVTTFIEGTAEQFRCASLNTDCVAIGSTNLILRANSSEQSIRIYNVVGTADDGNVTIENKISNPGKFRLSITNQDAARKLNFSKLEFGNGAAVTPETPFVGFSQKLNPHEFREVHVYPDFGGLTVRVETRPHYFCVQTTYRSYPDTITKAVALGEPCQFASTGFTHSTITSHPGQDVFSQNDWHFKDLRLTDVNR